LEVAFDGTRMKANASRMPRKHLERERPIQPLDVLDGEVSASPL
jgi:hypothetical protein